MTSRSIARRWSVAHIEAILKVRPSIPCVRQRPARYTSMAALKQSLGGSTIPWKATLHPDCAW